jgi:hypothetical protein
MQQQTCAINIIILLTEFNNSTYMIITGIYLFLLHIVAAIDNA